MPGKTRELVSTWQLHDLLKFEKYLNVLKYFPTVIKYKYTSHEVSNTNANTNSFEKYLNTLVFDPMPAYPF